MTYANLDIKSHHRVPPVDKTSAHGNNRAMLNPPQNETQARPSASPSPLAAPSGSQVTGLLLAGGLGRRMGGADKGLVALDGRPMAAWVIDRLRPQVGTLLINANRNPEVWNAFGCPVIPDRIAGYAGPLAGLHAGLHVCSTALLVSVPCDSPFLPADLLTRLGQALSRNNADLAVVRTRGGLQPVFALMRREVLSSLEGYLNGGGRKIDAWFDLLNVTVVDFDDEDAFLNINTPDELAATQPASR